MGCDLSQGATVILLGVDEFDGLVTRREKGQEELDRRVERFFTRCSRHVSSAEPLSLTSLKSGRVVVFVCGKTAHDSSALKKLAGALQNLGKTAADLSVSVGIGGFTPSAGQMARGYQEALVALKVGRKLQGPGSMLHFEDVGTYRLLLDIWERDPDEIRTLYEDTIGPGGPLRPGQQHPTGRDPGGVLQEQREPHADGGRSVRPPSHHPLPAWRRSPRSRVCSVFQTEHKERLGLGLKARSLLTS